MCTYNTGGWGKNGKSPQHLFPRHGRSVESRRGVRSENTHENVKDNCSVNFDVIENFFSLVWEKKACVLKEANWIDSEDNILVDNMMADLDTLPPALALGLTDTQLLCQNRSMEATMENLFTTSEYGASAAMDDQDHLGEQCASKTDSQTLMRIEVTLQKLAFFACVQETFWRAVETMCSELSTRY